MRSLLLLVCGLAGLACSSPDDFWKSSPGQCGESSKVVPTEVNRDLDLLFVIDDSSSMAAQQANLRANFARFVAVLEHLEGGLPNLHIGVVSADVGVGSALVPGCTATGDDGRMLGDRTGACPGITDGYLTDIANYDGTRTRNYDGTLTDAFACLATVGSSGCDYSQPLEAMRRALPGDDRPENQGFLRPNAFLAVIFITGQDDCSADDDRLFDPEADELGPLSTFRCFDQGVVCDQPAGTAGDHTGCVARDDSPYFEPIQEYVEYLRGLKEDPNLVLVSIAVGPAEPVVVGFDDQGVPTVEPSCVSVSGEGQPAIRLVDFAQRFPQRNILTTICNQDLSDLLILVAQFQATTMGVPCVEGNLDLDPDTPGVQFDCTVSDFRNWGSNVEEEILVPQCQEVPPAEGALPCWTLEEDSINCGDTATQSRLRVYRGPASVPSIMTMLRCFTGCDEEAGPSGAD